MDKIQLENEINNILKTIGIWESNEKYKFIIEGIKVHFLTLNEIGTLDIITDEERLKEIHTYSNGYVCGYLNRKRDKINEC